MALIPDKIKEGVFIDPDTGKYTDEIGVSLSLDQYKKMPDKSKSVLDRFNEIVRTSIPASAMGIGEGNPELAKAMPVGSEEQLRATGKEIVKAAPMLGSMAAPIVASAVQPEIGIPWLMAAAAGGGAGGKAISNIAANEPVSKNIGKEAAIGAIGELGGQLAVKGIQKVAPLIKPAAKAALDKFDSIIGGNLAGIGEDIGQIAAKDINGINITQLAKDVRANIPTSKEISKLGLKTIPEQASAGIEASYGEVPVAKGQEYLEGIKQKLKLPGAATDIFDIQKKLSIPDYSLDPAYKIFQEQGRTLSDMAPANFAKMRLEPFRTQLYAKVSKALGGGGVDADILVNSAIENLSQLQNAVRLEQESTFMPNLRRQLTGENLAKEIGKAIAAAELKMQYVAPGIEYLSNTPAMDKAGDMANKLKELFTSKIPKGSK